MFRTLPRLFSRSLPILQKETTGRVGLPVIPNAREILQLQYAKILEDVRAIPETAAVRQDLEQTTRHKLQMVMDNDSIEKLEQKLDGIIVEELIDEAEDQLDLIQNVLEHKPWESEKSKIPVDIMETCRVDESIEIGKDS